jgi:hypothetical protein
MKSYRDIINEYPVEILSRYVFPPVEVADALGRTPDDLWARQHLITMQGSDEAGYVIRTVANGLTNLAPVDVYEDRRTAMCAAEVVRRRSLESAGVQALRAEIGENIRVAVFAAEMDMLECADEFRGDDPEAKDEALRLAARLSALKEPPKGK